jgi:hypothetical protein
MSFLDRRWLARFAIVGAKGRSVASAEEALSHPYFSEKPAPARPRDMPAFAEQHNEDVTTRRSTKKDNEQEEGHLFQCRMGPASPEL